MEEVKEQRIFKVVFLGFEGAAALTPDEPIIYVLANTFSEAMEKIIGAWPGVSRVDIERLGLVYT